MTANVEFPEAFAFLWDKKADDGRPVRYRAAHGGRGSAKSHSFAQALVIKGAEKPLRIGCFREIQMSIKESVKTLLDDKIETCGLGGFYTSLENEIRGKNGTKFVFKGLRSMNADAVKSLEGLDIAWVEEANRLSQRSLDILDPTLRKPGSELWFSWNPDDAKDPVDAMFRGEDGAPPGSIVREVNWWENPFFPETMRPKMEWDRKRDPEKYAHIWGGSYRGKTESLVFKNWTVEPFEPPSDAVYRFGADWGYAVDPTVLVRCYLDGRKLYVDQEAYMVGCEIDQTPQLFDTVPGSRRWLITADSSRPETISHMQRAGFKIVKAIKGPGSVEDGIEFLKSYDIIVHPRCVHTADELAMYRYKTHPLTEEVLPVLEDKENHVLDSLRYACEGVRRAERETKRKAAASPRPVFRKPQAGQQSWMGR